MARMLALLFVTTSLFAQPLSVDLLVGSADGGGYFDGRFSAPRAIAADAAGNLYVADTGNHAIRKISPLGSVTTLAGLPGAPGGFADGAGTLARFRFPAGIAVDPTSGAIYVSDKDNHVIRRIAGGVVTTIAGEPGVAGTADAVGTAAKFAFPRGLVVDANGIIYVADTGNHAIRRVTPDGVVTTFAGKVRTAGALNGTGTAATFSEPSDIAIDPTTGDFFVADSGSHRIRRITPAGVVTTVAGGVEGDRDGPASRALFNNPWGLDVDASGNVWIADTENHKLRMLTPSGQVSSPNAGGLFPSSVAIGPDGAVYFVETGEHAISRFANNTQTLFAGSKPFNDFPDSFGEGGSVSYPADVAVDPRNGNVYIAMPGNIRRLTPDGDLRTIDGAGLHLGVAVGPDGTVYFSDYANNVVEAITPSNSRMQFDVSRPGGLAVDASGRIYVTTGDYSIRVIIPGSGVIVLAGGGAGFADGNPSLARFNDPRDLVLDELGNVYVADFGNNAIRKITSTGVVSTVATGILGPNGITRDAAGNLYVSDYNHTIRRIAPNGTVTVVAGLEGSPGNVLGVGEKARFYYPAGLAIDTQGRLLIADEYNHAIKIATVFTPHKRRAARR